MLLQYFFTDRLGVFKLLFNSKHSVPCWSPTKIFRAPLRSAVNIENYVDNMFWRTWKLSIAGNHCERYNVHVNFQGWNEKIVCNTEWQAWRKQRLSKDCSFKGIAHFSWPWVHLYVTVEIFAIAQMHVCVPHTIFVKGTIVEKDSRIL